jgi:hypothetical protein
MQSVHVTAPRHLLGRTLPVRIDEARALSLSGSLATEETCGMVA